MRKKTPNLKRLHRKVRRVKRLKGHPFIVPIITFMLLFMITLVGFINFNSTVEGASDSHVVDLYVDGSSRTVPTRANTVGELLERLDVSVSEQDIVEPALDTVIIQDNFKVNVYKARPVAVIDEDGKRTTIISAHPEPRKVAAEAGIKTYPEDIVQTDAPGEDFLQHGLVADKVVIDRAVPMKINLYGNIISMRTHATTVEEALTERQIKTLEGDTIQPAATTPIVENTTVTIARFGTRIITEEEVIAPPVETVEDPNLAYGETTVREEGTAGKRIVTYEVELKNNKEVGRKALQTVVAENPVRRVVARGTKIIITDPSQNVAIGEQMAAARGWTGSQWYCLYQLWTKESNWRTNAYNPSGAYGIPQALPGSKMSSHGSDWRSNPRTQIAWGMDYISGRYGTPCGAWNHSQRVNWY